MSEKTCMNCLSVKARRGEFYCTLLKQKVSQKYKCGRFRAKRTA